LSLKENVEFIKEELNSEEKFFEKAVVTERFVKKYKKPLIAGFALIVVLALGNVAYTIKEENRLKSANEALAVLMKNPTDIKKQDELKSLSPKLYEVWSFYKAVNDKDTKKLNELKNSKLPFIGDISSYEVASSDQKVEELDNYSLKQNALYKDMAIVQSAVILLNKNEIKKAKDKLALISEDSQLKPIAETLNHYGVK
jgi:hypothetical protein